MTALPTTAEPARAGGTFRRIVLPVLLLMAAMWVLETLDVLFRGSLDNFGIESRTTNGLFGIVLSPFLHGGFSHLIANTLPFLLLGLLVSWRSDGRIWPITILIAVVGGLAVWLFGPPATVTIGASGLIFGYLAYILAAGFLTRHWLDVVIAVVVLVVYGSALWGVLPFAVAENVSWLAHLTGFAAGVLAAFVFAKRPAPR